MESDNKEHTAMEPSEYGPVTETRIVDGKEYQIIYAEKEDLPLHALYGCAYVGTGIVHIRKNLPERIRKFVVEHELYHMRDTWNWGGTLGSELRACVVPGISDPIGLAVTVWATLCDPERRQFYWKRITGQMIWK